MATAGFNVTDELKKRVDEAAEQFIAENGGSKGDFLTAMLGAWETSAAKVALPGRADDIDTFEGHLAAMKASYMHSLYVAKTARDDAEVAVQSEIQKAQQKQADMLGIINDLKAKLRDAEANIKETEARSAKEIADNAKAFTARLVEIGDIEARAKDADAAKAQVEKLTKELADAKSELEQQKGRYAEKLEVALAKADNEKNAALLKVQQEAEAELEGMRQKMRAELEAYATKLSELSSVSARQTLNGRDD